MLIANLTDSKSERIMVISSANKLTLISLLFIFILYIFLSFLILLAVVSWIVINTTTDRGQPWLTPIYNINMFPVLPLLSTVDTMFLYIVFTYPINSSPKLTFLSVLNKKLQFNELNAFSKSIDNLYQDDYFVLLQMWYLLTFLYSGL